MRKQLIFSLFLALFIIAGANSSAQGNPYDADIVVAADGSGDFTTIQAAIDAVPSDNDRPTIIYIKRGLYNTEKLIVPADKINITMIGESRDETIISYHLHNCTTDDYQGYCPAEDAMLWSGDNLSTAATLTILGDGFHAENLTIENTAGATGQAQAITTKADKVVFINCNLTGYQDTMYLWDAGKRVYFENCLIIGRTDYIYGASIAFFQSCVLRSWGGAYITAPATPLDQDYGFVFNECELTYADNSPRPSDDGDLINLGRPWHDYPKVAWLYCDMTEMLNPLGWPTTWNMDYADTSLNLHLYEYANTGPGADMSGRADWAGIRELTAEEAVNYTVQMVMAGTDNWDPTAVPPAVTVYEWIGGGATSGWMVQENWNPIDTPMIGEAAIVDGDFTIKADGGTFEADLNLLNGAMLDVTASSTITYLTINKAGISSSQDVSLDGKIKTKDTVYFDGTGNLALNAEVLGIHSIIKNGSGSVTLNSDNSEYSGEWKINEGSLVAAVANALGTAGVVVGSGATLEIGHEEALFPKATLKVSTGATLQLNANVILSEFYIDGVIQPVGEYSTITNPGLIAGIGIVFVGRPTIFTFVGGSDNSNWDNPDHFVPALMPQAGDTVLSTLEMETTSTVFPANIFFSGSGGLRLRGVHRCTGDIHFASGTRINYNTSGTGFTLTAPMVVDGDLLLNMESGNTNGSTMTLPGPIRGSSRVTVLNNGKSADAVNTGTVLLRGDNSNFTGIWDLTAESTKFPGMGMVSALEARSAYALGRYRGRVEVGNGNQLILNHKHCAGDTLDMTVTGTGRGVLETDVVVRIFLFNGSDMGDGIYNAEIDPDKFLGMGDLIVNASLSLPDAPSGITVIENFQDRVTIEWSINAGNADGHLVFLDGNEVDSVDVDANSATITGLDPETQYTVGVCAYNMLGNSDTITLDVTTKPVGIEVQNSSEISFMPNPVENILYLQDVELAEWELYNLKGRVVKSGNSTDVDTADLAPGTYVLKVQTNDDVIEYLRFIKK